MKFKTIAIITAFIALLLGLGLEFAGATMMERWGVHVTDGVLLLCRRIGVLYIGLGVMLFIARSAPASTARTAISCGATVVLSLLSCLGVYEFTASRAGFGILPGAVLEALLALGFIWTLRSDSKEASTSDGLH